MRSDKNGYYSEEDFQNEFGGLLSEDHEESKTAGRSKRSQGKSKKTKTRPKGVKPNKPKKKGKKTALIVIVCLLVVIGAGVVLGYGFLMNKFGKVDSMNLDHGDLDIDPQVAKDLKDYRNILLIGIDTIDANGEDDEKARTDAIVIASINKKTNEVKLISVYRDSYLDVEEEGEHVIDKVNHAHAYAGPANTIRALNRNMDLNITEFMRFNWQTVADIIDEMGGIEVDIPDLATQGELNRVIRGSSLALGREVPSVKRLGKTRLNGVQAVGYCRMRYNDGDDYRANRVREVINYTFTQAKTMKLSELNSLSDMALSEVKTSMSSSEIMKNVLGLNSYKMKESVGWPYDWEGTMINGVSYDVPVTLESNVIELHEKVFKQKGYVPTNRVIEISDRVKEKSGYYGRDGESYE